MNADNNHNRKGSSQDHRPEGQQLPELPLDVDHASHKVLKEAVRRAARFAFAIRPENALQEEKERYAKAVAILTSVAQADLGWTGSDCLVRTARLSLETGHRAALGAYRSPSEGEQSAFSGIVDALADACKPGPVTEDGLVALAVRLQDALRLAPNRHAQSLTPFLRIFVRTAAGRAKFDILGGVDEELELTSEDGEAAQAMARVSLKSDQTAHKAGLAGRKTADSAGGRAWAKVVHALTLGRR